MANKYVTANNKLVVVDGKLLQVSGDGIDDELLNLIDTQTTSLGTTELSVSEIDTLIDNHIVDGVTLDSSVLLIDSPSNNSVEIKDIRVSNIDVAFITLNTTNGYVDLYGSGNNVNLYADTTLNYESGNITTDNLVAENIKKDVEILGVVGTHEGGASLNVAYGTTPPTDTSKIWLECEEPQAVEVQNYLGECAVSEVANYGVISNPVDGHSSFYGGYYNIGYMGNNQIAIVGYNHIRIYDLTTKAYIADYSISVGNNPYYKSVLYKDNVLYFVYAETTTFYIYSFDFATEELTKLTTISTNSRFLFLYDKGEKNKLYYVYLYTGSSSNQTRICSYNILTNSSETLVSAYKDVLPTGTTYYNSVKIGNYLYCFNLNSSKDYHIKINLSNLTHTVLSGYKEFMNSLGITSISYTNPICDGERYVYIIGGNGAKDGANFYSDLIIKYDAINDTCELLNQKLIQAKYQNFNVLVDNRVYIFGGSNDTSNNKYGRANYIDYFDISYPLTENNCIITTNTINTDNALPLINTDKLKINSNIASAYKGNADNLAEKVNAYYYDGTTWKGINCDDYTNEVVE